MGEAVRRVLVVDDEPDVLSLVSGRLESSGFTVSVAMDGESALQAVRQEAPDVILLDVRLPKLNGYEVCKALKQDDRTRRIPVILLTAKAEEADARQGTACGADANLTKPDNAKELGSLVSRLARLLQSG